MPDSIENILDLTELDELQANDSLMGIDDSQTDLTKKTILCKLKNWFKAGLHLIAGRIAFREYISTAYITVAGWYTIAETAAEACQISANFMVLVDQNYSGAFRKATIQFVVEAFAWPTTKTHQNTTIKYLTPGSDHGGSAIKGVRLAKNDSSSSAGFKVQVYLDPSTANGGMWVQAKIDNSAFNQSVTRQGLYLVEPTTVDNDKTPNGSSATFLEAGAKYAFGDECVNPIQCTKLSDNSLYCTLHAIAIPKKGTAIAITFPSTNLKIRDGAGTNVDLTSGTAGSVKITENEVSFQLTNTGAFTTLTNGPLVALVNGTGFEITIS